METALFRKEPWAPLAGAVIIPLWAMQQTEGWLLPASCLLGWVLLALAVIDLRRYLLPDLLTLPLLGAGLLIACVDGLPGFLSATIGAAAGFIVFFLVRKLYRLLRGREGLGFGDVKLLAALGAWLGWACLPSVVLIACLSGLAAAYLPDGAAQPAADRKLAFGAHLALAGWLVWLYGPLELP